MIYLRKRNLIKFLQTNEKLRQRPNGKSNRESREQNPKISPSPCTTWTPINTPIPRLTPRKPLVRRLMHFRTATPQSPHWLQWGSHIRPQNYLSSLDPSAVPSQTASISDQRFCLNEQLESNRWLDRMIDGSGTIRILLLFPGLRRFAYLVTEGGCRPLGGASTWLVVATTSGGWNEHS